MKKTEVIHQLKELLDMIPKILLELFKDLTKNDDLHEPHHIYIIEVLCFGSLGNFYEKNLIEVDTFINNISFLKSWCKNK